jgi:hypothetical protein
MNRSIYHLIGALVLLLVAVVGYAFWYYTLGSVSASAANLAAEAESKKQSAASATLAAGELERLEREEASIHAYFVVPDDIVGFLEGLQTKGAALGAEVTVVSVSAETAPRPRLDLAIKIDGSFDAVMRTMGAIEYAPYDLTVSMLTLSLTGEGEWSAAMKLIVGTAAAKTTP